MAGAADAGTAPLSRDRILAAALALADAGGIEKLSMRRVADALGCGAMSLYTHVTDKREVVGGIFESVIEQFVLPTTTTPDWRTGFTTTAASMRAVLQAHPWACELWHRTWPGPARKAYMEAVLRSFRESGFSPRMAHHGYHAFDLYVIGYVHGEVALGDLAEDPEEGMARFMAETPVATYPYMIEHVAQHDGDGTDDDFEFMLGLLLDGLDRHRTPSA